MYRIPLDLDLSSAVGQFTTQIAVGQFDLHFSFGRIRFTVFSDLRGPHLGLVQRWCKLMRQPFAGAERRGRVLARLQATAATGRRSARSASASGNDSVTGSSPGRACAKA
jgi:hypothetical protein